MLRRSSLARGEESMLVRGNRGENGVEIVSSLSGGLSARFEKRIAC